MKFKKGDKVIIENVDRPLFPGDDWEGRVGRVERNRSGRYVHVRVEGKGVFPFFENELSLLDGDSFVRLWS